VVKMENKKKQNTKLIPVKEEKNGKFCPLIKECLEECYCTNMSSKTIEAAIYFCGSNYTKCNIYEKRHL